MPTAVMAHVPDPRVGPAVAGDREDRGCPVHLSPAGLAWLLAPPDTPPPVAPLQPEEAVGTWRVKVYDRGGGWLEGFVCRDGGAVRRLTGPAADALARALLGQERGVTGKEVRP